MNIKTLTPSYAVSPQIALSDLALIKAAGFTTIINNRPDGEEEGQPAGAEVAAAAQALGLAYRAIPLGRDGANESLIAQTKNAIATANGPIFAYCRSGTRSTTLWALAQRGHQPVSSILSAAAAAGYDLSHLTGFLSEV